MNWQRYVPHMRRFLRSLSRHANGYLILSAVSAAGIGALSFVPRGKGVTQWIIPAFQIVFALLGSVAAYVQGRQADRESRIAVEVRVDQPLLDCLPNCDGLIDEWLAGERQRCLESLEEYESRRAGPTRKVTLHAGSGDGASISEVLELEEREAAGLELSESQTETLAKFRKMVEEVRPSPNRQARMRHPLTNFIS